MSVSRKPWLLITEFMKYKDLGAVLQKAARLRVALQVKEMLFVAAQIAESLNYLSKVH